jgi:hypothetical protein
MATPEQRFAASIARGYSKEFLSAACSCGHARGLHKSRTKDCELCACVKFALGSAPSAPGTPGQDVHESYCLGTVGPPVRGPRARQQEESLEEGAIRVEPLPDRWANVMDEARARDADERMNFTIAPSRGPLPPRPTPVASEVPALREGSATRCPFCHANDFETIPALKCPTCKAWQHHACVSESRRCGACGAAWPA